MLFLEVEETVDVGKDAEFEVKESSKKKRPHRDLDSMPQRSKRQKYSEEGVTSNMEEFDNVLEPCDQNDEGENIKETTDCGENTEGTQTFVKTGHL